MNENPLSVNITGDAELLRKLSALGYKALWEAGNALFRGMEIVRTSAVSKYVPIDTGTLRDSIYVTRPEYSKAAVVVTIGAGGAARGYATIVHETNRAYRNGRSWKYLETPLKESLPEIIEELTYSIEEAAKGV